MGSCMSNDKVNMTKPQGKDDFSIRKQDKDQSGKKPIQKLGIRKNGTCRSLSFSHSPLRYCDFLFSKFKQSDGAPEQVSLGFMLNRCSIDIQKGQIGMNCINSSMIKIWVVYGGTQKVSETGLTIQISDYKQLQEIRVDKPSADNVNGDLIQLVKLNCAPKQNVLVILEPSLKDDQTIFMIYRYQILPQQRQYTLITQSLQWSSLSFRINDIYGSENLFNCNDQNQLCSICLTNKSQCILLPCRHMCVCSTCLVQVQKTKPNCPLCRKQFYSVVKYKNN